MFDRYLPPPLVMGEADRIPNLIDEVCQILYPVVVIFIICTRMSPKRVHQYLWRAAVGWKGEAYESQGAILMTTLLTSLFGILWLVSIVSHVSILNTHTTDVNM